MPTIYSDNTVDMQDLTGHLSDGFVAYRMWLAIRQHFKGNERKKPYIYTTWRIKASNRKTFSLVSCSRETYEQKKNAIYFAKLVRKFNGNLNKVEDYMIANLIKDSFWGTGEWLVDDDSEMHYKEWLKRVEKLHYLYEEDNKTLRTKCKAEFDRMSLVELEEFAPVRLVYEYKKAFTDAELNSVYFNICVLSNAGTHPLIVREVLGGRVSVETLAIFMALSGCDSNWDHTDPSIANSVPRLKAYEGLLNYDPKRCLAIMRRVWHPTKNQ